MASRLSFKLLLLFLTLASCLGAPIVTQEEEPAPPPEGEQEVPDNSNSTNILGYKF